MHSHPRSHGPAHVQLEEATRARLAAHDVIVDRFRAQLQGGGAVGDEELLAFARRVAEEERASRRYVAHVRAALATGTAD